MKNYLAIFTGGPEGLDKTNWNTIPQEEREKLESQGMSAWGEWMTTHKDLIVYEGGPLGKTIEVNEKGISNITNRMCGYVIVKASSHEEAAKLFIEHPHFSIFPGEGVEIMECLSIPM